MNPKNKANIVVFLIISILALSSSTLVFSIYGDIIPTLQSEDSQKLIPITDNSFVPEIISMVQEKPVIVKNNITNQISYTANETQGNNTDTYQNESSQTDEPTNNPLERNYE